MTLIESVDPKRLILRYISAITLIVVFVLGGHGLHLATGKQGVLDEEVLNISGRQRMLSQRILFLSHQFSRTGEAHYADLMTKALDLFETSHRWIIENAVVPGTAVSDHYFEATDTNLDAQSKLYVARARDMLRFDPGSEAALTATADLEQMALTDLLRDLNTAVGLFEAAANDRAARMETIQILAVAATLVVLLLEVALIFYPAHRSMIGLIGRLKFQAQHDELTGLANRPQLMDFAKSILDHHRTSLDRVAALALDLDGFKHVNDTLGHPVGDQVLEHVARILDQSIGTDPRIAEGVIARMGGDEFFACFYLPKGDVEEITHEISANVIQAVEEPMPVILGDGRQGEALVGVSIGYALASDAGGDHDVLFSNADIALYASKRRGKGVSTAFVSGMRDAAEEQQRSLNELKVGLRSLEFKAYFDPQIDLQTGRIVGVEALARWDHAQRGLVGPEAFMDMAEENKLIDALDGLIMLDAFQHFTGARAAGVNLGTLSLNASSMALRDPDFCEVLTRIAASNEVAPKDITLEILETILIEDHSDPAVDTILKLSKAGFGIAIDDFGIGFSSLARVADLNVNAIKLDQSLVAQSTAPKMNKIVAATAAMAKGLNSKLLASGIATDAQHRHMKELGVSIGQGPFWSCPLPSEKIVDWFAAKQNSHLRVV